MWSEDIFCNRLPSLSLQLVGVFLYVVSLYYNPNFSQKPIFMFHIGIGQDIGHKCYVYKTYVRSMYVLVPEGYEEASKPVILNKSEKTVICTT